MCANGLSAFYAHAINVYWLRYGQMALILFLKIITFLQSRFRRVQRYAQSGLDLTVITLFPQMMDWENKVILGEQRR